MRKGRTQNYLKKYELKPNMKVFRFMKYGKEYRSELFKAPYFWIGLILILLGIILGQLKIIGWVNQMFLLLAGFFFIFGMKQRILGRIEERHFKNK